MLKTESYKKGIIQSTGLNIIAKGIGFLNSLIIAFYFGTSAGTDIYFFVIAIAMLVTTGMINGIDTIILIPEAMKLRERDGEEKSRNFLNFFIILYFFIGAVIFLVIAIAPTFFYDAFSKFPNEILVQHKQLLYAGGLLIFLQLINNLLSAILNSYKYFTISILTGLVTSLFSIIITIFFHKQLGIAGTLAAVIISYAVNFLFLITLMKMKLRWHFRKFILVRNKHLWGNIGLMQLNILPVWLRNYVTLFLLSGLGEGIVTSVNLAQQVASIIDTLIISQVLSVAGIKFNELYAKMDMTGLNLLFIKIADHLLVLLMPVVLITFFYADEIAALFFKRGHMMQSSLDTIAFCLKYLILLLPFTMLNSMCTRIFSSTQLIRQGLLYSIAAHVIFLVLTIVLINWLQLTGYLYSMIAGFTVLMFLFYRLFKIKLHQIDFGRILVFGGKQVIINLAVALPVFFLLKKLTDINYVILIFIAAFIQVLAIGLFNKKQMQSSIMSIVNSFRNK